MINIFTYTTIKIFLYLISLYKKNKLTLIIVLSILFYVIVYSYHVIDESCDGWGDGLVDTLDNEGEYCEIKRPYICWPSIWDNKLKFGSTPCNQISEKQLKKNKIKALEYYGFLSKDDNKEK